jgi:hypothetical protein
MVVRKCVCMYWSVGLMCFCITDLDLRDNMILCAVISVVQYVNVCT